MCQVSDNPLSQVGERQPVCNTPKGQESKSKGKGSESQELWSGQWPGGIPGGLLMHWQAG